MRINKKQDGHSLIAWIVLTPFALIIIGVLLCEANKAYWDYRVTQMCEKDGGVTVYESISLSKGSELISSSGNVIIPGKWDENSNAPYYVTFSEMIIRDKFPRVRRAETKIIRRIDLKVLSLRVSYSRGGGDFPTGIAAPSSFSCRSLKSINTSLTKPTFSIEEI